MTELSYFWDGTATGDAVQAPYDKVKFNRYFSYPTAGVTADVRVVPGYLDDLEVQSGGTSIMAVKIGAGAAYIRGYIYVSDAIETLNISPVTTGYCRWDRVVLRLDYIAQTVRLAVVEGVEQLSYANPAGSLTPLTQTDGSLWECDLATVYVTTGSTYVLDYLVYDKRLFLETHTSKQLSFPDNLVNNSEFLAFSGSQTAGVDPPEGWTASGTITSIVSAAALSPMSRGRGITCTFTSDSLMIQDILLDRYSKTISIKGLINVTSGTPFLKIEGYRVSGALSTKNYIQAFMRPQSSTIEFTKTLTFPEDDIVSLRLSWYGVAAFTLGQLIITHGYKTGPFRQFNEVLMFTSAVTDASWTATAKSDGTTTINTTSSFGNLVLKGTKAAILRMKANDSASGVAVINLSVKGYATPYDTVYGVTEVGGSVNDIPREVQFIVPINQSLYYAASNAPQFRLVVDATGASTLDATVEVVGIMT